MSWRWYEDNMKILWRWYEDDINMKKDQVLHYQNQSQRSSRSKNLQKLSPVNPISWYSISQYLDIPIFGYLDIPIS